MESLENLRKTPHLSVSALKLWMSCPRKYRLRYIDKARPSHRSIALVFGHAWHSVTGHVLMLHQKQRGFQTADLRDYLAAALQREIESPGPPVLFDDEEDADALVTTGMRMLEAFLATVPMPQKVLRVELPFRLQLFDPETGEALRLPLIGAIDALVQEGDRLVVWEQKSSLRRWSPDAVAFDFQPTAYRMAMREFQDDPDKRHVDLKLLITTKAKCPDVQVEDLVRTQADERELSETAASIVRAVEAGCLHPARSWMCTRCEFAEVCR